MDALHLDLDSTALVLIDLQRGIVDRATAPHTAADVVQRCRRLSDVLRDAGATIVHVRVATSRDDRDRLRPLADVMAPEDKPSVGFGEFVPEVRRFDRDLVITKRQWGAFYGTELDLQLRRRGIRTIVLAGISTNIGVESTARDAFERGYNQVFVSDAMTSLSVEAHELTLTTIFPRLGRVRTLDQVIGALHRSEPD